MRNTTVLRGAAILLALLVTVDAAYASIKVTHFPGTRDQLRSACKGEGKELVEGRDHTICFTATTGVVCGDDKKCVSSGPRTIGDWGFRTRDRQVPQSLVDAGGSSGGGAVAPSAPSGPAPSAPTPPIFN
jgi:hypothetical protein